MPAPRATNAPEEEVEPVDGGKGEGVIVEEPEGFVAEGAAGLGYGEGEMERGEGADGDAGADDFEADFGREGEERSWRARLSHDEI